ncbi:MAG: DUF1963 domain-containing protein [Armatimonadetes bacterium]|nr:DUF1963 domain-containing protein [Armatimonadota bacterium]
MTPNELYAERRAEAIERIRTHAPARLQDTLINFLRPAIALSATRVNDSEITVGASKFGGSPDVPAHFEWPTWNDTPLGFLAQINLEEVAPFDLENKLPKAGMLWFFVDFEDMPEGDHPDQKMRWRVSYFRPSELARRMRPEAETDENTESIFDFKIEPALIQGDLELIFDISSSDDNWLNNVEDMDYEIYESVAPTLELCKRSPPIHRLLGRHEEAEEEIKVDCIRGSGGNEEDWILLLQIQTGGNYGGMPVPGQDYLSFSIKSQDLMATDFSNVWFSRWPLPNFID